MAKDDTIEQTGELFEDLVGGTGTDPVLVQVRNGRVIQ